MERPYTILLVDDSESDRAIYSRYLLTDEDVDYQILEAETLEESLQVCRSQLPDMVLADLHLPDGNGLELLTAIQAKDTRQKCPVIVITGQGNEQIAVQAMKLGARDYLVKGDITATVLGNCVKNALNEWTTSKELTEFSQESENYTLGNITNIPDYKQAEQENIRLRKRFQFLLASSPTIIYSCKPYGDYGATFISDNTETILGYQPEQFITQERFWANHLHPEDAPKIFAEISALFEKGTHTHEYRFLHQDGHYLWIRDQLQLVKDDQGNPIEIIGSFSDISDRKNQEKELRESETRFRQLAENIDEVFYLVDIQANQMLYISPSYEVIWQRSCQSLYDTPESYLENVYEEDRLKVIQAYEQKRLKNNTQVEYRIVRPDGSLRWILDSGFIVKTDTGEVTRACGTAKDISDRKVMEKNLEESRDKFQRLVDEMGEKFVIFSHSGVEGILSYVSDGAYPIFGLIKEDILGQPWSDVVNWLPEEIPNAEKRLLSMLQGEQDFCQSEMRFIHPDGSLRTIQVSEHPVRNETGELLAIEGIVEDISDRKQAEEKLRNLTERLSIALTSGAIGCWEWNIINNTLTWDERIYELYDIPLGTTILFETWLNSLHPDDQQTVLILAQQILVGEAEYETEFRVIHSDNSIHFLKSYGVVMRDDQGNAQGIIGVNFDITKQKQAEQTIRQQAEKETLLRQITQHIRKTLDLQTIFETACQEIRQFIQSDRVGIFRFYPDSGYDDGEFVAESLQEGFSSVLAIRVHDHCFGEDYSQRYAEGYFQAVNDVLKSDLQDCHKEVLTQFQIRANLIMPLLLGEQLWGLLCIHACAAPRIWQPDEIDLIQQIAGQLAIAIQQADLFEQLEQEQEKLTQTNQDLARATRLKDEFLANMSHELRTPLTAILGMSEALQTNTFGEINPSQEKAIKLIEKSGEHLLSLITDILDFSKIEAGKLELNLASTSVQNLCENSTIFVRQMAFTKNIELQTRIAENIAQIQVDELRIRQCLINLLSNSLKFTPPGGHVILSVELEEKDILFSVTDTGIGISPGDLDKLFQPFIQIDSKLNRQYAGTGLGLVLVERIITKHGGKVSVTSRVGEGSCFTLRLPYIPSSRKNIPDNVKPENVKITPLPIQQKNVSLSVSPLILLADDDEGNRKTLDDYLSNKGYRMLLAYNGREALEMVKTHQPDLILMDIQMPEMDGLEATTLIRSDPAIAHIPIIALTALALPEQLERCLAVGINEYLVKPLRFKVLMETIQKFC